MIPIHHESLGAVAAETDLELAPSATAWIATGSNRAPPVCKTGALPDELATHNGVRQDHRRPDLASPPLTPQDSNLHLGD